MKLTAFYLKWLIRRTLSQKYLLPSIARVVLVVFCTNVAFATKPEENIWKQRRTQSEMQLAQLPNHLRTPALPHLSRPQLQNELLKKIPGLSHPMSDVLQKTRQTRSKNQPAMVSQLPSSFLSHVSLRTSYQGRQPGSVILLEDVHLNQEAQNHLSAAIQSFGAEKGNRTIVVGLEGAEGPLLFDVYQKLANPTITTAVANVYLDRGEISGPAHAGFTHSFTPGFNRLRFWGVDDRKLHADNVAAYHRTKTLKTGLKKELSRLAMAHRNERDQIFNSGLKEFDAQVQLYRQGKLKLTDYIQTLASFDRPISLNTETFLQAYAMEKKLRFDRIEAERARIVQKLVQTLSEKQLQELLELCLAYQQGDVTFAEYYAQLRDTCRQNGIHLARAPHFDEYIRYVLLTDGIKIELLFKEIAGLEKAVYAQLSTNQAQRDLAAQDRLLYLMNHLMDFSLTTEEWAEIQPALYSEQSASKPWAPLSKLKESLKPFSSFYEIADARNQSMVRNLIPYINKLELGAPNSGFSRTAVLVAGGFHTKGLAELLKKEHISYVVASPKITKFEDGNNQTHYLSVFDREKTSLEKIFTGERLFVVNPPAGTPGNPSAMAKTASMAEGVAAVQTAVGRPPTDLNKSDFRALGLTAEFDAVRSNTELNSGMLTTVSEAGVARTVVQPAGQKAKRLSSWIWKKAGEYTIQLPSQSLQLTRYIRRAVFNFPALLGSSLVKMGHHVRDWYRWTTSSWTRALPVILMGIFSGVSLLNPTAPGAGALLSSVMMVPLFLRDFGFSEVSQAIPMSQAFREMITQKSREEKIPLIFAVKSHLAATLAHTDMGQPWDRFAFVSDESAIFPLYVRVGKGRPEGRADLIINLENWTLVLITKANQQDDCEIFARLAFDDLREKNVIDRSSGLQLFTTPKAQEKTEIMPRLTSTIQSIALNPGDVLLKRLRELNVVEARNHLQTYLEQIDLNGFKLNSIHHAGGVMPVYVAELEHGQTGAKEALWFFFDTDASVMNLVVYQTEGDSDKLLSRWTRAIAKDFKKHGHLKPSAFRNIQLLLRRSPTATIVGSTLLALTTGGMSTLMMIDGISVETSGSKPTVPPQPKSLEMVTVETDYSSSPIIRKLLEGGDRGFAESLESLQGLFAQLTMPQLWKLIRPLGRMKTNEPNKVILHATYTARIENEPVLTVVELIIDRSMKKLSIVIISPDSRIDGIQLAESIIRQINLKKLNVSRGTMGSQEFRTLLVNSIPFKPQEPSRSIWQKLIIKEPSSPNSVAAIQPTTRSVPDKTFVQKVFPKKTALGLILLFAAHQLMAGQQGYASAPTSLFAMGVLGWGVLTAGSLMVAVMGWMIWDYFAHPDQDAVNLQPKPDFEKVHPAGPMGVVLEEDAGDLKEKLTALHRSADFGQFPNSKGRSSMLNGLIIGSILIILSSFSGYALAYFGKSGAMAGAIIVGMVLSMSASGAYFQKRSYTSANIPESQLPNSETKRSLDVFKLAKMQVEYWFQVNFVNLFQIRPEMREVKFQVEVQNGHRGRFAPREVLNIGFQTNDKEPHQLDVINLGAKNDDPNRLLAVIMGKGQINTGKERAHLPSQIRFIVTAIYHPEVAQVVSRLLPVLAARGWKSSGAVSLAAPVATERTAPVTRPSHPVQRIFPSILLLGVMAAFFMGGSAMADVVTPVVNTFTSGVQSLNSVGSLNQSLASSPLFSTIYLVGSGGIVFAVVGTIIASVGHIRRILKRNSGGSVQVPRSTLNFKLFYSHRDKLSPYTLWGLLLKGWNFPDKPEGDEITNGLIYKTIMLPLGKNGELKHIDVRLGTFDGRSMMFSTKDNENDAVMVEFNIRGDKLSIVAFPVLNREGSDGRVLTVLSWVINEVNTKGYTTMPIQIRTDGLKELGRLPLPFRLFETIFRARTVLPTGLLTDFQFLRILISSVGPDSVIGKALGRLAEKRKNSKSEKIIAWLKAHVNDPDVVRSIFVSPSGNKIVFATEHQMQVWNIKTGALEGDSEIYGTEHDVVFSPDEKSLVWSRVRIASYGPATSCTLWNFGRGEAPRPFLSTPFTTGGHGHVTGFSFEKRGRETYVNVLEGNTVVHKAPLLKKSFANYAFHGTHPKKIVTKYSRKSGVRAIVPVLLILGVALAYMAGGSAMADGVAPALNTFSSGAASVTSNTVAAPHSFLVPMLGMAFPSAMVAAAGISYLAVQIIAALPVRTMKTKYPIESASVAPDERFAMAVTRKDKKSWVLTLFGLPFGNLSRDLGKVKAYAFSPDGSKLVTQVVAGDTIHFYSYVNSARNAASGQLKPATHAAISVQNLGFTPSRIMAVHPTENIMVLVAREPEWSRGNGARNGQLAFLDLSTGRIVKRMRTEQDTVFAMNFDESGEKVILEAGVKSVLRDYTGKYFEIWNWKSSQKQSYSNNRELFFENLRLSPDGKWLAASLPDNPEQVCEIYRVDNDFEMVYRFDRAEPRTAYVSFDFSPNSRYFAIGNATGFIQVVDLKSGDIVFTSHPHSTITSVKFVNNERLMTAGGEDRSIKFIPFGKDALQSMKFGRRVMKTAVIALAVFMVPTLATLADTFGSVAANSLGHTSHSILPMLGVAEGSGVVAGVVGVGLLVRSLIGLYQKGLVSVWSDYFGKELFIKASTSNDPAAIQAQVEKLNLFELQQGLSGDHQAYALGNDLVFMTHGRLAAMIQDGIQGMTSNPSIYLDGYKKGHLKNEVSYLLNVNETTFPFLIKTLQRIRMNMDPRHPGQSKEFTLDSLRSFLSDPKLANESNQFIYDTLYRLIAHLSELTFEIMRGSDRQKVLGAREGQVSIETNSEATTEAIVQEAVQLKDIGGFSKNILVKIASFVRFRKIPEEHVSMPGEIRNVEIGPEMLSEIDRVVSDSVAAGVVPNVTLGFGPEIYATAVLASLKGLNRRMAAIEADIRKNYRGSVDDAGIKGDIDDYTEYVGHPLVNDINIPVLERYIIMKKQQAIAEFNKSVFSYFASRYDAYLDKILPDGLKGKLGVAMGKVTYEAYEYVFFGHSLSPEMKALFGSETVDRLQRAQQLRDQIAQETGMNPEQRFLVASSQTKDEKNYSSVLYVLPFMGDPLPDGTPRLVNTLPLKAIESLKAYLAQAGLPILRTVTRWLPNLRYVDATKTFFENIVTGRDNQRISLISAYEVLMAINREMESMTSADRAYLMRMEGSFDEGLLRLPRELHRMANRDNRYQGDHNRGLVAPTVRDLSWLLLLKGANSFGDDQKKSLVEVGKLVALIRNEQKLQARTQVLKSMADRGDVFLIIGMAALPYFRAEHLDRLPARVSPDDTNYVRTLTANPDFFADVMAYAAEKFRMQGAEVAMDLSVEPEAFLLANGIHPVMNYEGDVADIQSYAPPLTLEQVKELKIPNPAVHGRLPVFVETMRKLKARYGDKKPLVGYVYGAFSLAARIIVEENAMLKSIEDKEYMDALLEKTAQAALVYAKAQIQAGADVIVIADPSSNMVSLRDDSYDRFIVKWINYMTDEINKLGAAVIIHTCRDKKADKIIPYWAKMRGQALSVAENVDMKKVYEEVAKKKGMVLIGSASVDELAVAENEEAGRAIARKNIKDTEGIPVIRCLSCDASPATRLEALLGLADEFHKVRQKNISNGASANAELVVSHMSLDPDFVKRAKAGFPFIQFLRGALGFGHNGGGLVDILPIELNWGPRADSPKRTMLGRIEGIDQLLFFDPSEPSLRGEAREEYRVTLVVNPEKSAFSLRVTGGNPVGRAALATYIKNQSINVGISPLPTIFENRKPFEIVQHVLDRHLHVDGILAGIDPQLLDGTDLGELRDELLKLFGASLEKPKSWADWAHAFMAFSAKLNAVDQKASLPVRSANTRKDVVQVMMIARAIMARDVAAYLVNAEPQVVNIISENALKSVETFIGEKISRRDMPESARKQIGVARGFVNEWLPGTRLPHYVRQGIVRAMLEGRSDDLLFAFGAGWRQFGTAGIRNQAVNSAFDGVQLLELEEFARDAYAPVLSGPNTINTIVLLQQTATAKLIIKSLKAYVEAHPEAKSVKLDELLRFSNLYEKAKQAGDVPNVIIDLPEEFKSDLKQNKVTFAYDSRLNGQRLAHILSADFLRSGIKVDLFDAVAGMPILVYAASRLHSIFGFLISASHSEPNYNGFKFVVGFLQSQVSPSFQKTIMTFRNLISYEDMALDLAYIAEGALLKIISDHSDKVRWLSNKNESASAGKGETIDIYSPYYEHLKKRSPIARLLSMLSPDQRKPLEEKFEAIRSQMNILYTAFSGAGAVNAGNFPGFLKDMGYKAVTLIEKHTLKVNGRFLAFIKKWVLGMPDPGSLEAFVTNFRDYLIQEAGEDLNGIEAAIQKFNGYELSLATDPDIDRSGNVIALPGGAQGNVKQPLLAALLEYIDDNVAKGKREALKAKVKQVVQEKMTDKLHLTANDAWMFLVYNNLKMLKEQGQLRKDKLYVIIKSHVTTSGLEDIAAAYRKEGYHVYCVDTYVGFTLLAERADQLFNFGKLAWEAVGRGRILTPDEAHTILRYYMDQLRKAYDPLRGRLALIDDLMQKAEELNKATHPDNIALMGEVINTLKTVANLDLLAGVEESNGWGEFGRLEPVKGEAAKIVDEHIREKDGSLAAYKFAELAVYLRSQGKSLYEAYSLMLGGIGSITGTENLYTRYRGAAGVQQKVNNINFFEKLLAFVTGRAQNFGESLTFFGKYKLDTSGSSTVIFRDQKYDDSYLGFPEEGVQFNLVREFQGNTYKIIVTYRPSGTGMENRDYNWVVGVIPPEKSGDLAAIEKIRQDLQLVMREVNLDFFGDPIAGKDGLLLAMQKQGEPKFRALFAAAIGQEGDLKLTEKEEVLLDASMKLAAAARQLKGNIKPADREKWMDENIQARRLSRKAWSVYQISDESKNYPDKIMVTYGPKGSHVVSIPRAMARSWVVSAADYVDSVLEQTDISIDDIECNDAEFLSWIKTLHEVNSSVGLKNSSTSQPGSVLGSGTKGGLTTLLIGAISVGLVASAVAGQPGYEAARQASALLSVLLLLAAWVAYVTSPQWMPRLRLALATSSNQLPTVFMTQGQGSGSYIRPKKELRFEAKNAQPQLRHPDQVMAARAQFLSKLLSYRSQVRQNHSQFSLSDGKSIWVYPLNDPHSPKFRIDLFSVGVQEYLGSILMSTFDDDSRMPKWEFVINQEASDQGVTAVEFILTYLQTDKLGLDLAPAWPDLRPLTEAYEIKPMKGSQAFRVKPGRWAVPLLVGGIMLGLTNMAQAGQEGLNDVVGGSHFLPIMMGFLIVAMLAVYYRQAINDVLARRYAFVPTAGKGGVGPWVVNSNVISSGDDRPALPSETYTGARAALGMVGYPLTHKSPVVPVQFSVPLVTSDPAEAVVLTDKDRLLEVINAALARDNFPHSIDGGGLRVRLPGGQTVLARIDMVERSDDGEHLTIALTMNGSHKKKEHAPDIWLGEFYISRRPDQTYAWEVKLSPHLNEAAVAAEFMVNILNPHRGWRFAAQLDKLTSEIEARFNLKSGSDHYWTVTPQTPAESIIAHLSLAKDKMIQLGKSIGREMRNGLKRDVSSLKMLDTYALLPTGKEKGRYISLNWGGSNATVDLVTLKGNGDFTIERSPVIRFTEANMQNPLYVFNILAERIQQLVGPSQEEIGVGFIFSFPMHQTSIRSGTLIEWTKKWKDSPEWPPVTGKDVAQLMNEALQTYGLRNVKVQALANDTLNPMIVEIYRRAGRGLDWNTVHAGSILGTGHNNAVLIDGRIINLEMGGFAGVDTLHTPADRDLDRETTEPKPGKQLFEKMVSGDYIREVVRRSVLHLADADKRFQSWVQQEPFRTPYALKGTDVSRIAKDSSGDGRDIGRLLDEWGISLTTPEERNILRDITLATYRRSARMVAAAYVAAIQEIDPSLSQVHTIAIEGSLFQENLFYQNMIKEAMVELIGKEKAGQIQLQLVKAAEGVGAAILAATAQSQASLAVPSTASLLKKTLGVFVALGALSATTLWGAAQGSAPALASDPINTWVMPLILAVSVGALGVLAWKLNFFSTVMNIIRGEEKWMEEEIEDNRIQPQDLVINGVPISPDNYKEAVNLRNHARTIDRRWAEEVIISAAEPEALLAGMMPRYLRQAAAQNMVDIQRNEHDGLARHRRICFLLGSTNRRMMPPTPTNNIQKFRTAVKTTRKEAVVYVVRKVEDINRLVTFMDIIRPTDNLVVALMPEAADWSMYARRVTENHSNTAVIRVVDSHKEDGLVSVNKILESAQLQRPALQAVKDVLDPHGSMAEVLLVGERLDQLTASGKVLSVLRILTYLLGQSVMIENNRVLTILKAAELPSTHL